MLTEPIFDHERLDVYRLAIDYVSSSYRIAKSLHGPERHARDQWLRAAQSIPLNIAEGNGKQSLKDKNRFFEIARVPVCPWIGVGMCSDPRRTFVLRGDRCRVDSGGQDQPEAYCIDVDPIDPT